MMTKQARHIGGDFRRSLLGKPVCNVINAASFANTGQNIGQLAARSMMHQDIANRDHGGGRTMGKGLTGIEIV